MADEFKIGDDIFTVNPLPGERSFILQPKIAPALAEIMQLAALFFRAASSTEENKVAAALPLIGEASDIIGRLCAKLPPETLQEIMRELLRGSTMNGKQLYGEGNLINVLLRGRTIDTWKLLMHAMEVSYPDFFGLARGLRAKSVVAGAGSKESTTSATPGPVGASG